MDELDALDTYNGETEHDIWVDFDNFENTGSHNFSMNPTLKILFITLMTGTNAYFFVPLISIIIFLPLCSEH